MGSKRVVVSVINDLATDQRVRKTCAVLMDCGYEVRLIGRRLPSSLPLDRPYKTQRLKFIVNKGAWFYAAFNARLFFVLLFAKTDLFYANDLDTLLANRWASKIKRKPLIYDSHECFSEVPELVGRKFARGTWLRIEKSIFPRLKHVLTVNESIAKIYREKYKVDVKVMRNLPQLTPLTQTKTRKELGLPEDKKILILQGSGINVDRGGEELVQAMQFMPDYYPLIVGGGDVIETLKQSSKALGLDARIRFVEKLPYEQMMCYTQCADLGLTLDKDTNLNYRYSLPNKIFDYLKAGIPVMSSDLIELRKVIDTYKIGVITTTHNPEQISATVKGFLEDENNLNEVRKRIPRVLDELNWDRESGVLKKILQEIE